MKSTNKTANKTANTTVAPVAPEFDVDLNADKCVVKPDRCRRDDEDPQNVMHVAVWCPTYDDAIDPNARSVACRYAAEKAGFQKPAIVGVDGPYQDDGSVGPNVRGQGGTFQGLVSAQEYLLMAAKAAHANTFNKVNGYITFVRVARGEYIA